MRIAEINEEDRKRWRNTDFLSSTSLLSKWQSIFISIM